jgi:hypothetical protein
VSNVSDGEAGGIGPMDFSTFVISLGSSVLIQLGEDDDTPAEAGGELAKQSIDILTMLEEKTSGNLTDEESALLTSVLYQTRMAYVDARR